MFRFEIFNFEIFGLEIFKVEFFFFILGVKKFMVEKFIKTKSYSITCKYLRPSEWWMRKRT